MQPPPNCRSSFLTILAFLVAAPSFTACAGAPPRPPAPPPAPPREPAVVPVPTPVAQPTPTPTPAEPADDHAPARVARRFPILNGRLTAVLPAGSHEMEPQDDAPPLDPGVAGSNSWHAVSAGSFEVTATSFELFAPVEADFERQVREGVARWDDPPSDYRLEPVAARPPVRVLLMRPAAPLSSGIADDLMQVCLLYVAHPDGTVQAIELHAPRTAAAARVLEIAEQIGESLEAGPLPLPRVAGERTIAVYGSTITGQVPDGFVGIVEPGMDSTTASFVELSPIATRTRTIAMTVAPSGPPDFPGRRVAGRLFGQSTTLYAETTRGLRMLHGILEFDTTSVSVDLSAPTPAGLAGLRAIVENLRFIPAPEATDEP